MHLQLDIFELRETKLPVRLINNTNERRLVQGHETPLKPSSRKSSREVGGRGREVGGPDHSHSVLPLNRGEAELNSSVTCMVLKATANDLHHLALSHDEFCGP
ncbi:hypothetical protein TNCV_1110181 [Trichonephila clavipes]|nr:hypothetical protein TNCV_1110181 [Trichonephila clavipes]